MALFGGSRPKVDWSKVGTFLTRGMDGLDRRRDEERALQALQQRTMQEDRLRAALSPADGPMGPGTGAAPSIQQQIAALDEARLLNPEVADKFAPLVQGRRMAEMTANMPIEQRLAIELNPERAGQSFATQFEDMPLAAGTVRTRGNQAVIGAPRVERFDDRFGSFNPVTGQTSYSEQRGPTYAEKTQRITAERPQLATVSPGQEVLGVSPYGQTTLQGQSTQEKPLSASDQNALDAADQNLTRLGTSIGRAEQIMQQIQDGALNLGPLTNTFSGLRNQFGRSDANSLNYDALLAWAKEARNAALSANTGVQTDQDAIRELDTIISNIGDERVVSAALGRYIDKNKQTVESIQRGVERRMSGRGGQSQPGGQPQVDPSTAAAAREILRQRGRL